MTEPIRGKVARVLNGQEIVLNAGIVDGVTVGMDFNVMDPNGEDIRDPDTNEFLGSIERPKVKVRVIHTQEKLAVATPSPSKGTDTDVIADLAVSTIPTLGPIARSLMPPSWVERSERPRKTSQTSDALNVKIGDPVVQVIEETE